MIKVDICIWNVLKCWYMILKIVDVGIVCKNMIKLELDYIDSLLLKFLRNREKC